MLHLLPFRSSVWFRVLFAALCVFSTRQSWAVDEATRAALRDLGTEGVQAYQAGDYESARQKLDEAFSILRTAPLGLWSARALEKSGLLVQASERYLAAERAPLDPEGDQQAQLDAREVASEERQALLPRIPKLTVQVEGAKPADVTLVVGGKEVPSALIGKSLPVNPGTVDVVAKSGGAETAGSAELGEGESKSLVLKLEVSAADPSGAESAATSAPGDRSGERKGLVARKWPALVAAGVAVAGGVVWTVFGVQSMDAKSQADGCTAPSCSAADEAEYRQQAWDAGNVATVGMVLTGVGLVGAGVLWFTLPGAEKSGESAAQRRGLEFGPVQRVQVGVRPGGLQLRGVF